MILTNKETADAYIAGGMWGRVTLDAIFRRNAQTHPDRAALIDTEPNGRVRNLGYAEVDRRITALSGFFTNVGLKADSIVALQLPVSANAVIALLGALRAGLIVAVIPELWRRHELVPTLSAISPKALVCHAPEGDNTPAERMRDIAAELFSVRFVCAFGDEVPDGVVPLETIDVGEAAGDPAAAAAIVRKGNAADHIATLSFVEAESSVNLIARSHNHWISAGLHNLAEARIDKGTRLFSCHHPLGLVGMSSALVPWLLSGGTLVIDRYESMKSMVSSALTHRAERLILPDILANAAWRDFAAMAPERAPPSFTIVHGGENGLALDPPDHATATVHVHRIGEIVAIPRNEGETASSAVPLGRISASAGSPETCFLETRLRAISQKADGGGSTRSFTSGELTVRGPTIPDAAFPVNGAVTAPLWDDNGFMLTGLTARLSAIDKAVFRIERPLDDTLDLFGSRIAPVELDEVCASHEDIREAAIVAARDPHRGHRLCVLIVPEAGRQVSLDEIEALFRARSIAPHKIPVSVRIVEEIPRDAEGRIRRSGEERRAAAA